MKNPKRFLLLSLLAVPTAMWAAKSRKDREEAKESSDEALSDAFSILSDIPDATQPPAKPGEPAQPPPTPKLPKLPKRKLSDDEKELFTKLSKLVKAQYQGNPQAAFMAYAGSDGLMSSGELEALLSAADVGYPWTRSKWAEKIMEKVDKNQDGQISWDEYYQAVTQ